MRISKRPQPSTPSAPHVIVPADQARALSRRADLDEQQRSFRTSNTPQPPTKRRPPG